MKCFLNLRFFILFFCSWCIPEKKSDVIKGFKIDTMVDYFARAESNTFARYHFTKRKTINYGSCMYLCAAMCNHSCFPSAARDWSGQDLKLRALYPIEEGKHTTYLSALTLRLSICSLCFHEHLSAQAYG